MILDAIGRAGKFGPASDKLAMPLCLVEAARVFPGAWSAEQEPVQLEWLLAATNAFVNTFRPRVLWLLPRGSTT